MTSRVDAILWLWIGAALLFAAVVAPALFAVLPTRAMAGLVVGRVLPVVFWSGALAGGMVVIAGDGWRRWVAVLIVACTLGAQLVVSPKIERLREAMGDSIESIAPTDPRRTSFGALHGVSVALLGVALLGAAAIAFAGMVPSKRRTLPSVPPVPAAASSDSPSP